MSRKAARSRLYALWKESLRTCRKAFGACFNCESFDYKVKDFPNPNNVQ